MNRIKSTVLAAAVALSVVQPMQAVAQMEDFFTGVGTVIAVCALTQSCGSNRPATNNNNNGVGQRTTTQRPAASPVVMADQNALNYFGFPAGTADGLTGSKTRTAISAYQAYMGWQPSGVLNDYERSHLQASYQRSMAGGASQYAGLVAREGTKGLLRGFQREAQGLPVDPSVAAAPAPTFTPTQPAVAAQQAPAVQQASMGSGQTVPGTAAPAAAGVMPSFARSPEVVSINQFCGEVNILTSANGQMVDAATMTDPGFALDEQFCAARGHAISRTQQLSAGIRGISDTDLQAQCEGMISLMAPQVNNIGSTSPDAFETASATFVQSFGMSKEQLTETGEVCLGLGYRVDNSDMVLASAAILVGAGNSPFGEVFGHHLRKGFGAPANDNAARGWFDYSLTALEAGNNAVFLPTQSQQRVSLMRLALGS